MERVHESLRRGFVETKRRRMPRLGLNFSKLFLLSGEFLRFGLRSRRLVRQSLEAKAFLLLLLVALLGRFLGRLLRAVGLALGFLLSFLERLPFLAKPNLFGSPAAGSRRPPPSPPPS